MNTRTIIAGAALAALAPAAGTACSGTGSTPPESARPDQGELTWRRADHEVCGDRSAIRGRLAGW